LRTANAAALIRNLASDFPPQLNLQLQELMAVIDRVNPIQARKNPALIGAGLLE
jgi:hypothetical protein